MFFFYNGFVPSIFLIVFICFIVAALCGRRRNDYYRDRPHNHSGGHNQPRLTVEATVVDKFVESSHSGRCCVVFEVESRDRLTFTVNPEEYNLLVLGDRGRLSFQGSYYYGFTRHQ